MKTSEAIDQIAGAMVKAQEMLKPAIKDATNPAFRAKYADLASVWDAWKGAGPQNGLAAVQDVTTAERGIEVTTRILHTSGQWLEFGPLTVPLGKMDAHGVGSATSYAKRYALSAAVGIVAEEDDDGNAAAASGKAQRGPYWEREEKRASAASPKPEDGPKANTDRMAGAADRPANIDADGVVTRPPTAAEANTNGYAQAVERAKKWPAEIAAVLPPDEALYLMADDEAEANRALYVDGIKDMAARRKLNAKEKRELAEMFFGSPNTHPDKANIYLLRAMWLYLDPERP